MTFEKINRKGTSRERKARALQLEEQLAEKIADAMEASARAERLQSYNSHVAASRAWRRVVYPATRLDLDATIYRDAVRRHIDAAELLGRGRIAP